MTPLEEGSARLLDTIHKTLKRDRHPCHRRDFFLSSRPIFVLHPYLFLCLDCPNFDVFTTQISMPPAGFESTLLASDRPQTLAVDLLATWIGIETCSILKRIPTNCTCKNYSSTLINWLLNLLHVSAVD